MTTQGGGLVAAWYRGAWWLWLLRPVEWLFRVVSALRRGLYRIGLLKVYHANRPLIVVGNITVGGTGKTPIVIAIVEALSRRGLSVGVVSRGYGATSTDFPHVVTDNSRASDCGDEPLLIYRRTACPCVVSPSRAEAVRTLLEQFSVDLVLSDDGLQHYAMARDFEIAVLDNELLTGNGFCLPAGPLREPPARLGSVDFVLYRGSDDPDTGVIYRQDCLVNLRSGARRSVQPQVEAEQIYAVAGIGQPQQFFRSLESAGFSLEAHSFADHHAYVPEDFHQFADKPIIMTEKDAVKCREFAGDNAWYLKIDAQLPAALCDKVAQLAQH